VFGRSVASERARLGVQTLAHLPQRLALLASKIFFFQSLPSFIKSV
jgi:hypothetical protein